MKIGIAQTEGSVDGVDVPEMVEADGGANVRCGLECFF